jgi:RES domain-containing protein
LEVPSAVVPRECNYVLNPVHPDFAALRIEPAEPYELDLRLLPGGWDPVPPLRPTSP